MRYVAGRIGYPLEAVLFLIGAFDAMVGRIGLDPAAVDLRVIRKAGGPVSMVAAGSLVILGLLSVAAISLIA